MLGKISFHKHFNNSRVEIVTLTIGPSADTDPTATHLQCRCNALNTEPQRFQFSYFSPPRVKGSALRK